MNEYTPIAFLALYKVSTIVAGTVIVYFGYRLFQLGMLESAGTLEAASRGSKISLKSAAPGTFFALFGAMVIWLGVYRGFLFEYGPVTPVDTQILKAPVVQSGQPVPLEPERKPETTSDQKTTADAPARASESYGGQDRVIYKPPPRGAQGGRVGGGTR